jgi:hypothetical protein
MIYSVDIHVCTTVLILVTLNKLQSDGATVMPFALIVPMCSPSGARRAAFKKTPLGTGAHMDKREESLLSHYITAPRGLGEEGKINGLT